MVGRGRGQEDEGQTRKKEQKYDKKEGEEDERMNNRK